MVMEIRKDFSWTPTYHMCRFCGAHVMKRTPRGLSVGEVYKCLTCGKTGIRVEDVCWCGQKFRNDPGGQHYICLPTNIREKYPEVKELFDSAFRSMGIDPDSLEIGVITFDDFNRIMREAEARRAISEGGIKALSLPEEVLSDIEKALEEEMKHRGTPFYSGLFLEKVWRDYLKEGKSYLFTRGLIWKLLQLLEKNRGLLQGNDQRREQR